MSDGSESNRTEEGRGMTITDITESPEDRIRRFAGVIEAVQQLHRPFRIYEECDHGFLLPEHGDDVVLIECEDFTTCEDGYAYSVCAECCCDSYGEELRTEYCVVAHEHDDSKPRCATIAALDEPVAAVTVGA